MCWTKVMQHWLNGVGKDRYPPTWEGLYMLLEDAEYPQVAEDLKKVVDDSTAEDSSVSIPVDGVSTIPADEGTPPACKYHAATNLSFPAMIASSFQPSPSPLLSILKV